jgi:hypothetical protein
MQLTGSAGQRCRPTVHEQFRVCRAVQDASGARSLTLLCEQFRVVDGVLEDDER